ncbi:MAG: YicC family protein [Giesbergeria sp.]|nr:YicC family protein [Giesbergeria sp.]MBP8092135.1 YicC family protein [Giesbergeria sp.]
MAVYSMTGYASAQHGAASQSTATESAAPPTRRLGLEIRSVNSRFLDLSFRLPDELRALEPALRALVTRQIKRGKVEVRASIESLDAGALPDLSPRLLQRLDALQETVRSWLPAAAPLTVAEVLRLGSTHTGTQDDWAAIAPGLAEEALQALLAARKQEGTRLATMLQERVQQLRTLTQQAVPLVPKLVEQQRQRFMERWKEAMGLAEGSVAPEAARDRALSEATAFAIRIDVAEEVTRLQSHLDEIERLLKKGGEVGKRLDFLIQELHREANTLGSKSAALELTRISVDMKVLIEQMREQVQNIE